MRCPELLRQPRVYWRLEPLSLFEQSPFDCGGDVMDKKVTAKVNELKLQQCTLVFTSRERERERERERCSSKQIKLKQKKKRKKVSG